MYGTGLKERRAEGLQELIFTNPGSGVIGFTFVLVEPSNMFRRGRRLHSSVAGFFLLMPRPFPREFLGRRYLY